MNNSIQVTYSDTKLRILVEEYIAMQRTQFTFRELCSYILYRAMEEGRTATPGLYDSNQLSADDCTRVNIVLDKIISEGRLAVASEGYDKAFV